MAKAWVAIESSTPTLSVLTEVKPDYGTATASAQNATVSLGTLTVSPSPAVVQASAPNATVVLGDATIAPLPAQAQASAVNPSVSLGLQTMFPTSVRLDDAAPDIGVTQGPPTTPSIGVTGPLSFQDWSVSNNHTVVNSGDTIQDALYVGNQWLGITGQAVHPTGGPATDDLTIKNVAFMHAGQRWHSRSFRMRSNNVVEDCTFIGARDEHGIYWNCAGYDGALPLTTPALIVRRTEFLDIASQCLQLMFRPSETGTPLEDGTPGGEILVEDVYCENCTHGMAKTHGELGMFWWNQRAGYVFSSHSNNAPGFGIEDGPNGVVRSPMTFRRVEIDNTMQQESHGCISMYGHLPKSGSLSGSEYKRNLVVEDCTFRCGPIDRPFMELGHNQNGGIYVNQALWDITLRNSHFEDGGAFQVGGSKLDIWWYRGTLTIDNCTGNVDVYRNGVFLGRIDSFSNFTETAPAAGW